MPDLHRLYRYVGPADIRAHSKGLPPGRPVQNLEGLVAVLAELGGARAHELTSTYVVDDAGTLRLADRSSEHVACAGNRAVFAAGEITFATDGAILEVSNQSTGFCPEPSCWAALASALDAANIERPEGWTAAFEFRRCDACGTRNLVKDEYFECASCGAALSERWNFDTARCSRVRGRVGNRSWRIDVIEEAGALNQDRAGLHVEANELSVALADGAGGGGGGAEAAELVARAAPRVVAGPQALVELLQELDVQCARAGGSSAGLVLRLSADGGLTGASVGDCQLWSDHQGTWRELSEHQVRKPLLGSGAAQPVPFAAFDVEGFIAGTDGLFNYVRWNTVERILAANDPEEGWRLIDAARLPTGALPDDVCIVTGRVEDARSFAER